MFEEIKKILSEHKKEIREKYPGRTGVPPVQLPQKSKTLGRTDKTPAVPDSGSRTQVSGVSNTKESKPPGRTSAFAQPGRIGVPPVQIQTFIQTRRKLPHWQSPASVYLITFTAIEDIEFTPEEKDLILSACKYWEGKKYALYAAVVMPTHVHLLI